MCAPVMRPWRSVTAAIIAGQIPVAASASGPRLGTVVTAQMESQAVDAMYVRYAASAQIGWAILGGDRGGRRSSECDSAKSEGRDVRISVEPRHVVALGG